MLMAIAMLAGQAAAPPAPVPDPDPVLARLSALYDEVCLQAFPIDAAVDKAMAAHGAKPLTPEQVRVTLVDDPGRGWIVSDGLRDTTAMLELPPYHACSVRRFVSRPSHDLAAYRAVADRFKAGHKGFVAPPAQDLDRQDIHIHAMSEARMLPGGTTEQLMLIEQTTNDPAKLKAGDQRVEYRFVHQIHSGP